MRVFTNSCAEPINQGFLDQLVQFSKPSVAKPSANSIVRTPVADLKNALALGFFETAAEGSSPEVIIERGASYQIVRKFRRAADDAPQNSSLPTTYAIEISGEPAKNLGISVEHPGPLMITENGRLVNKDFKLNVQTTSEFREANVNLTGELLRYDSETSLKEAKPDHREALDVPVATLKFTKKPSRFLKYINSGLDIGKRLFGLIGAIPTLILAYLKLRDRERKN
jgi:hypothetical protein